MKLFQISLLLTIVHQVRIASSAPHPEWATSSSASPNAVDMFNTAIEWNDGFWDEAAGYLVAASSNHGRYDTRHTAWYATQLLARNELGDVARAVRIFDHVIAGQYLDPSKQWYGNYQSSPSEPQPGTAKYPDDGPYSSCDPNDRVFVGCAWLVALSDFEHLLPAETVTKIEKSMYITSRGDLYSVGGVDCDNLYPCYSNPCLMRTILQTWVGARLGEKNLTQAGETFAQQIYDLWSQHQTLSEFNSPTYSGVDMWALTLWSKYAPEGSVLRKIGLELLKSSWNQLGQLYNANLKNVAGPWDRSYGYNMKEYAAILGAAIWGTVGREHAPIPKQILGMYHQGDFAFYPLLALAMPEANTFYTAKAFSPPFDAYPRNITTWMSKDVTIGVETAAENVVGGPATISSAFNPAVIQWAIDDYQVGCLTHWVTESSIHAVAAPTSLNISYPNATTSDCPISFNFLFSGLVDNRGFNVTGIEGLPGLDLEVATNALPDYTISYNTDQSDNEFIFYNITYTMPEDFTEAPFFSLRMVE